MFKCICSYENSKRAMFANHQKYCQQYRDYLKMIADDPKTVELIQSKGLVDTAKELGLGYGVLRKLMRHGYMKKIPHKIEITSVPLGTCTMNLCPCGFANPSSKTVGNHKGKCPVWHKYLDEITKNSEVLEAIKKHGILPVATLLGVTDTVLARACKSVVPVASSPIIAKVSEVRESIIYKDPTAEQVLEAIFHMQTEYYKLREQNANLEKQVSYLARENEILGRKTARAEEELKILRDKFNKAFALKIDAQSSHLAMESKQ